MKEPIKNLGNGNLEFAKAEADGQNIYWHQGMGWLVITTPTTTEIIETSQTPYELKSERVR